MTSNTVQLDSEESQNLDMNIIQIPGYTFYRHLDYSGNDIKKVNMLDLSKLKDECEKYDYCMGFNTLGWIKHSIDISKLVPLYGASKYEDGIYIRDMNSIIRNKIDKLNQLKHDPERLNKTYDITFSITTCKRLDLFIKTMNMLLVNCVNIDIIREFVCIDDNSSSEDREVMIKIFPFFTFVMKTESEKGHQKSMNKWIDIVKTKYNMHFEDDWCCNKYFDLKLILDHMIDVNFDILILRKICWSDTNIVGYIGDEPIWEYIYNGNHKYKPELNKEYDEEIYPDKLDSNNSDRIFGKEKYWWWPGFTLNPSIINFEKVKEIGYFNENIMTELFEYDYALRCHYAGIKANYINLNIEHTGIVSSYTLNDMKRYYD
mgnify:CR=1 FL=1